MHESVLAQKRPIPGSPVCTVSTYGVPRPVPRVAFESPGFWLSGFGCLVLVSGLWFLLAACATATGSLCCLSERQDGWKSVRSRFRVKIRTQMHIKPLFTPVVWNATAKQPET